jgi:hypothetical protein
LYIFSFFVEGEGAWIVLATPYVAHFFYFWENSGFEPRVLPRRSKQACYQLSHPSPFLKCALCRHLYRLRSKTWHMLSSVKLLRRLILGLSSIFYRPYTFRAW